ncbi:alpha/beta fold hydrolase [Marinoscillum sp. MHG1-6]|uniref:alpha/beta fold hydrolase n=1 Tax=Marinoscillum sp. MHG1-6 TaxID=2959627 RepID=UPI00215878DD|nr:alpha/beta hydrolase [Marinoscillum sp. MHG1-6]
MAQNELSIAKTIKPYPYDVKYHTVNDSMRVAYVDEGQGANTLIFIHGLATYIPSWFPVFESQKTNNRCIALDLPGYGLSSKGQYAISMNFYAEVVISLIEALKLKNVILVGHSMGAQIAITSVLNRPEIFTQLILLAPAGFETFTPEQTKWLKTVSDASELSKATDDQIRANWKLNFFNMPESVEFMINDRIQMKKSMDFDLYCRSVSLGITSMLEGPVFSKLGELKTRTLVVYGANDLLIPNRYLNPNLSTKDVAQSGVNKIPDATLKLVPNCGHFITYDQPEEVNKIIHTFLFQTTE